MGEPAYTEAGYYNHGTKNGPWYKIDSEGELMVIENYRDDLKDGEVKYYEEGKLSCIGHYKSLKQGQKLDTIVIVDPISHLESYRAVPTDAGTMRHGMWQYYNTETKRLIREEEYVLDEIIYQKEFPDMNKDDSLYMQKHQKELPHNKGVNYTPPPAKRTSYSGE